MLGHKRLLQCARCEFWDKLAASELFGTCQQEGHPLALMVTRDCTQCSVGVETAAKPQPSDTLFDIDQFLQHEHDKEERHA